MTTDPALLQELRLLRAMGETGRKAATAALRAARLASSPDPDGALKFMIHELDTAIVQRGGKSIFTAKPVGELSAEAEQRLQVWASESPQRHAGATGRKPNDDRGHPRGPDIAKPGRLVGTLMGKLGGFASDREDER